MQNLNFKVFFCSFYLNFGLVLSTQSQNLQGTIYIIETDSASHSFTPYANKIGTIRQLNDTTLQIVTFNRATSKSDTVTKYVTELFDYERVFKNERLFCYSDKGKVNYFTPESQLNLDHISAYLNEEGIKKTKAKPQKPLKSGLMYVIGIGIEVLFRGLASN